MTPLEIDVHRGASSPALSALYEREHAVKGEDEFQKTSDGIFVFMVNNFIPLARAEVSKALDNKVKGDHCRYFAKCATGDAMGKVV